MKIIVGDKVWSLYFRGCSPRSNYIHEKNYCWSWNGRSKYEGTVKLEVVFSEIIKELLCV